MNNYFEIDLVGVCELTMAFGDRILTTSQTDGDYYSMYIPNTKRNAFRKILYAEINSQQK